MVRSAAATASLKGGSLFVAFLASLLYARALGPDGYGAYAYVIAWSTVLTVPAGLGYPQYLIREGSRQPESVGWLLRWATQRTWLAGLGAIACMLAAAWLWAPSVDPLLFLIAAPLPLLTNLANVRTSLLQVRGKFVASQWPQLLLAPTVMLGALLVLWRARGAITAIDVTSMMTLSVIVGVLVTDALLRRSAPGNGSSRPGLASTRQAVSFMWIGMLYLLTSRIDLIMLGTLVGPGAAGVYSLASRMAELVSFVLFASNTVIAPRMAQYHQQGDREKLQRLLSASGRRVFLATLPIACAFVLFAPYLMRALYGTAFLEGATALQLLTVAQLFNVFAGPTALLLNMTGHEKLTTRGVGIALVTNTVLNAILIPPFGANGAACATAVSLILWNTLLWIWIRRTLSLRPSAMGR